MAALLLLPHAPAGAADDEPPRVGGDELYGSGLLVGGAATPLPAVGAKSFLIADLDTGDVLAAQNAHAPLPPASTIKMLTALTVLPRVDLDGVYVASGDDVRVEGSKVGIVEGSTYTARQLFEGMFLVSGNDAANAVASLTGDFEGTLAQMQAEAGRLQAYDTVVQTPHGLDAAGQVSSAYDLALMARAGLQDPDFTDLATLGNSTFPMSGTAEPQSRPTFEIWNQNTLVTGDYEGAIGVKSGFTTEAGRTLAAAAERDGQRYLVTLMGIEGSTYETGELYLDWAFDNGSQLEPVGSLVAPKFASAPSDGAVVLSASGAGPAGEVSAAGSLGSRFAIPTGTVGLVVAIASIGAVALLWLSLRTHYRDGVRWRPAPAPRRDERTIDLREQEHSRV